MTEAELARLRELARTLDESVPKSAPRVDVFQYGFATISANRVGYARLAVECLKAASAGEIEIDEKGRLKADLDYIRDSDGKPTFDEFRIREWKSSNSSADLGTRVTIPIKPRGCGTAAVLFTLATLLLALLAW